MNEARAKYEKCLPYRDAIAAALDKKDWDKVFAEIDEMEKAVPPTRDDVMHFSGYDGMRLSYATEKKDGSLASKIARRMISNITAPTNDSGYIASKLLAVPDLAPQDADLAELLGREIFRAHANHSGD